MSEGPAPMGAPGRGSDGRRVAAAAALLAASMLLSRVLGYAREAVLAWQVGVSPAMDAYRAAFQLPDLLNHLLAGGALSVAFIPLYTRARERRGAAEAERFFATVLGTLGLAAVLLTGLLFAFAAPLVALQFGGFDAPTQALCTRLTRIVLPAQVFFVAGGILRGVLMAEGRFGAQAVSGIVYNLGIIGGGLAGGGGPEGFAWGALAGAAVGAFGIPLAQLRGRVRLRLAPRDPVFTGYLRVALPLMIGASLLTVDEWYERWFGDDVGEGVIAILGYARQLMLAPVAVVGQAVAVAALPSLSRLWSEGRRVELDRLLLRTLQLSLAVAVLAGAAVFAVADPFVTALFQRGAFGARDAEAVAGLLRILCLAVPGWVVQQVAVRAFYARGDTWRPMLLGTGIAVLAVPLYLELGGVAGARGLAGAGVIAISANALATLLLARRLHAAPDLRALGATLGRALLAVLPAVALARAAQRGGEGLAGAALDLALGGAAFAALALPLAWVLGDAARREAVARLLRRRRASG